ncbi:MAG: spore germination protein [Lawsonibacter sp.]
MRCFKRRGCSLPSPIGATVSILGGLVVGNAAVEARIVSPAVLIAVAIAGVAGYTMPSQDFAAALRLWRFLLAILASAAGLFGLAAGCAGLIYHLASLETFGVPYLAPFTAGAGQPQGHPNLLAASAAPDEVAGRGQAHRKPEESAMKKRLAPAALAVAAALLAGCGTTALPYAREMGDMALLRTMGVDAGEKEGDLRVTVSTGKRAAGLQGEGQPPLILSAEGGSLSSACLAMQGLSDSYVFYGYVDQLLLGEELALEGVQTVLDYFAQDVELGLGTQLWLIRGDTAQGAVQAGEKTGVDSRLSTLQTDSEMGAAGVTRTVGETSASLLEWGSAYLPALRAVEQEREGETALLEAGYGVLRDGRLVGYLDGEGARGLELLTGRTAADILEIELPSGRTVVRLTGAAVQWSPEFQGNDLKRLHLTCRVTAALAEGRRQLEEQEQEQLRRALEAREEERLRRVLDQLRSWGADCAGVGSQVGRADPARWEKLRDRWTRLFSTVPVEISVEVSLGAR